MSARSWPSSPLAAAGRAFNLLVQPPTQRPTPTPPELATQRYSKASPATVAAGAEGGVAAVTEQPIDLATALAGYDAQRRPRTQQIARAAYQIGRFGQQLINPVAVALRNAVMRVTPPGMALRTMARYADWHPPALPPGGPAPHARVS